jgi:hypothetical protein
MFRHIEYLPLPAFTGILWSPDTLYCPHCTILVGIDGHFSSAVTTRIPACLLISEQENGGRQEDTPFFHIGKLEAPAII